MPIKGKTTPEERAGTALGGAGVFGLVAIPIGFIVYSAVKGKAKEVQIAAADSPRRDQAKYLCTGYNDQQVIQAAMNEEEPGSRLLLQRGNYYLYPEGDYCLTIPQSITLEGMEEAGVNWWLVQPPAEALMLSKDWSWAQPWSKIEYVKLKNLNIDLGRPAGVWRESAWGNYYDFNAIRIMAESLVLENVNILSRNPESVVSRLFLWQCGYVGISYSTFDGVAGWIFSQLNDIDPYSITGSCSVRSSDWINAPVGHMTLGGFMNNFEVLGCNLLNCSHTAIDIGISPDARVEGNVISGAKGSAIYSEGSWGLVIRNNTIEDTRYMDPAVPWDGFGIQLADALHMRLAQNILIEKNTIRNAGTGICSRGVPDIIMQNNNIEGMKVHGIDLRYLVEGSPYYQGIPSYPDGCKVLNNRILNYGREVEWSRAVLLCDVVNCRVENNTIDGYDNPGAYFGIGELHWPHADVPETRPDWNVIKGNLITGVQVPIDVVGPNTRVE